MVEKLKKYGQEHLLKYIENLSDEEKDTFTKSIDLINFDLINQLYNEENNSTKGVISSITPIIKKNIENLSKYIEVGKEVVNNGELALITMAGGQGTRLGFDGPKGTFVLKDKSLFEIIADKIRDYNIPWLIMTSEENDTATRCFFEKNNNFGIKDVKFFVQKMLPLLDENGKIIIGHNGKISLGADGSGGVYSSLKSNNLIEYLDNVGIKYTFINGVDNCLTNPVDFEFIGMAKDKGYELACKSVIKSNPLECVGVFCYSDNKPYVVEYIDLDENMRFLENDDKSLVYGDAHILANLFSLDLLKKVATTPLKFYRAHKKCNYIDINGNKIKVDKPNAYKFETFIFDAFKYADNFLVMQVNREDEFAPIKNADDAGVDCPKTALELFEKFIEKNK